MLHMKLKTKESHATVIRILRETIIEIVVKEKHSRVLYEAAKLLGKIYLDCHLLEHGEEILRSMRKELITGTATSGTKFDFHVDKSVKKISFVFMVTFEETIGGTTRSYSEILSGILTEWVLYESYHQCLRKETSIEVFLVQGARLRLFLHSHKHKDQLHIIDQQLFDRFIKTWEVAIKTRREITMVFFISLLGELGIEDRKISIGDAACIAGNHKVSKLLGDHQIQEAYEVALCTFHFIKHQRAYHHSHNVGHGFKLASLLAGRGLQKALPTVEPTLHAQMIELSREIIQEVLAACTEAKINFRRLKQKDLSDLVGLLGAQKYYTKLEVSLSPLIHLSAANQTTLQWLLEDLWSSRQVQKHWTKELIIEIGKRLIQAKYLAHVESKEKRGIAIHLCEDICYNLRRVWGSLDPKTLELLELLSHLYIQEGHFREAMAVHEEILRLVVEGDDGDDRTLDTMVPETARLHVDLLKASFHRLGKWDKSRGVYRDLITQLLEMKEYEHDPAFKDLQPFDKWNVKDPLKDKEFGRFVPPKDWEFDVPKHHHDGSSKETDTYGSVSTTRTVSDAGGREEHKRPGLKYRATSNWGMGLVNRFFHHGEQEQEEEAGNEKQGNGTVVRDHPQIYDQEANA